MRLCVWLQALLLTMLQAVAKRDKTLYCSVCRALVEEVSGRIGDVDPKKVVQIGSFRVDPHGNQKLVQKQYARSEVHLTEIFEDVCRSMSDYVEITTDDGMRSVVRQRSRAGVGMDLKNAKFNPNNDSKLRFYCDLLVEDYEDEMISLFRRDNLPSIETAVCGDIASACTEEELSRPLPALSEKKDRENMVDNIEDYLEKEEDDDSNVLEYSDNKGREKPASPDLDMLKQEL